MAPPPTDWRRSMRRLEEIEAEMTEVEARTIEAKARFRTANDALEQCVLRGDRLYAERREVWEAEDEALPRVFVVTYSGWGSRPTRKEERVIVRRTDKTIFARPAGARSDPAQFRLGKDGRYWAYGKHNTGHLEFPDDPT